MKQRMILTPDELVQMFKKNMEKDGERAVKVYGENPKMEVKFLGKNSKLCNVLEIVIDVETANQQA